MIDLTGASLVAYLLRIIRDVAGRHPRYRKALGEVTFSTATARTPANLIQFGDVQVIIKEVSAEGNQLSPDYFMDTQHGRAILAKVETKEGLFVEFIREVDPGYNQLDPGVYYMNVDSVDESTREVELTLQKFKWREGHVSNATGSLIYYRTGLDGTLMVPSDGSGSPPTPVSYQSFPMYTILYTPINMLVVTDSKTNQVLVPNVDYWIVRQMSKIICQSTYGGVELISVPTTAVNLTFEDQEGYQLRQGIDFVYFNNNKFIQVSQATPKGSTITAVGQFKEDPSGPYASVGPENYLDVVLQPGESITPNQVSVITPAGNFTSVLELPNSALIFPVLLGPGQWAKWETRINALMPDKNGIMQPQVQRHALKMEMNKNLIPGLWIAIGDLVVPEDQVAVIVSPTFTETYEVFGSKENIDFTLEVKSNDLTSASEISEMIKHWLLVQGRTNMEADGITVFKCSRTQRGQQKDPSGVNPTYSYDLGVSAAADWKEFIPMVTRLVSFEFEATPTVIGYPGKLNYAPRMKALGTFQFIPWTA
jgi:hypothetical protein